MYEVQKYCRYEMHQYLNTKGSNNTINFQMKLQRTLLHLDPDRGGTDGTSYIYVTRFCK